MEGIEKPGISRRGFLRAAGTLGVSGGLLGAYAGRAHGHNGEDHGAGVVIHNITEGVGIAAPILKERPHLAHFVWLALLGGGPAIVGTWIGGFAFSNLLAAVFLAVGAGAILQVIYQVISFLLKDTVRSKTLPLSAPNLGGLVAGVAIMYATALLTSVLTVAIRFRTGQRAINRAVHAVDHTMRPISEGEPR